MPTIKQVRLYPYVNRVICDCGEEMKRMDYMYMTYPARFGWECPVCKKTEINLEDGKPQFQDRPVDLTEERKIYNDLLECYRAACKQHNTNGMNPDAPQFLQDMFIALENSDYRASEGYGSEEQPVGKISEVGKVQGDQLPKYSVIDLPLSEEKEFNDNANRALGKLYYRNVKRKSVWLAWEAVHSLRSTVIGIFASYEAACEASKDCDDVLIEQHELKE